MENVLLELFSDFETAGLFVLYIVLTIRCLLAILLALKLQGIADAKKWDEDIFCFVLLFVVFFGTVGALVSTLVAIAIPDKSKYLPQEENKKEVF